MSTLYFFSGFDKEKGFTEPIGKSLREHIKDRKSLAFIASCPYGHEKTDTYKEGQTAWFRNIGIEFENVCVIDDRKPQVQCIEEVKNASVIFLMGGITLLQIEFLQTNKLIPVLKQHNGAIMGLSAGAINMAVNSFYSADNDHGRSHIYKGIGLADISIEPHFSLDNKDLLNNEILPFSDMIDIYAICDNGAIVVSDDKREYYGDVYLISKGEIEKIN